MIELPRVSPPENASYPDKICEGKKNDTHHHVLTGAQQPLDSSNMRCHRIRLKKMNTFFTTSFTVTLARSKHRGADRSPEAPESLTVPNSEQGQFRLRTLENPTKSPLRKAPPTVDLRHDTQIKQQTAPPKKCHPPFRHRAAHTDSGPGRRILSSPADMQCSLTSSRTAGRRKRIGIISDTTQWKNLGTNRYHHSAQRFSEYTAAALWRFSEYLRRLRRRISPRTERRSGAENLQEQNAAQARFLIRQNAAQARFLIRQNGEPRLGVPECTRCTRVYQSVPECTRVYQSVPECTRVYQRYYS